MTFEHTGGDTSLHGGEPSPHTHTHGAGVELAPAVRGILERGLSELVRMTEGLAFSPLASSRYPLPLTLAMYREVPDPEKVRQRVLSFAATDPVSVLEDALVLLELYECNQPASSDLVPDDEAFLGRTFRTKRGNGWLALAGDADPARVEADMGERFKFDLVPGRERRTSLYPLLNMVARYGFVYGRISFGDSHALGHFTEDYCPAMLLCRGQMNDLELTLSLAAMKLGVPAVVPVDYPFPLGRQVRADDLGDIEGALAAFPNIHHLLDLPGVPPLPEYVSPEYAREQFAPAACWGDTPESFYILRKGTVEVPGVMVSGQAAGPMGIILTAEAEPLDAFDRSYIEARAARALSMLRGVMVRVCDDRLVLDLAPDADAAAMPQRIGETLIAAIRNEFPKIERLRAEVIFDRDRLCELVEPVCAERAARAQEIASATEESIDTFATCVGCSPFAPDHACVLTPERPPQCNRRYETIRTGALYSFDDMSNIHHRVLHAGINSFGICQKGEAIDPVAGEWSGVNEAVSRLTGERTGRVQLHSLDEVPHTGCSCFQLIMFLTDQPRPGVGVMRRGYAGRAPDGRTWSDLHYALTGKQAPGLAGASPAYLVSEKFLAAHGGWEGVVWVSPRIAAFMGDRLPETLRVKENP